MSTQQLLDEAISLPLAERLSIVQALWESIDGVLSADGQGQHTGKLPAAGRLDIVETARNIVVREDALQAERLYQELKTGAEASAEDFVPLDVEAIIREARRKRGI